MIEPFSLTVSVSWSACPLAFFFHPVQLIQPLGHPNHCHTICHCDMHTSPQRHDASFTAGTSRNACTHCLYFPSWYCTPTHPLIRRVQHVYHIHRIRQLVCPPHPPVRLTHHHPSSIHPPTNPSATRSRVQNPSHSSLAQDLRDRSHLACWERGGCCPFLLFLPLPSSSQLDVPPHIDSDFGRHAAFTTCEASRSQTEQ
jgi:hypothetical protein